MALPSRGQMYRLVASYKLGLTRVHYYDCQLQSVAKALRTPILTKWERKDLETRQKKLLEKQDVQMERLLSIHNTIEGLKALGIFPNG